MSESHQTDTEWEHWTNLKNIEQSQHHELLTENAKKRNTVKLETSESDCVFFFLFIYFVKRITVVLSFKTNQTFL